MYTQAFLLALSLAGPAVAQKLVEIPFVPYFDQAAQSKAAPQPPLTINNADPNFRNGVCLSTKNADGAFAFAVDTTLSQSCCSQAGFDWYGGNDAHCAPKAGKPNAKFDTGKFSACCNAPIKACCTTPKRHYNLGSLPTNFVDYAPDDFNLTSWTTCFEDPNDPKFDPAEWGRCEGKDFLHTGVYFWQDDKHGLWSTAEPDRFVTDTPLSDYKLTAPCCTPDPLAYDSNGSPKNFPNPFPTVDGKMVSGAV